MARPNKYRRICELPINRGFGPVREGRNRSKDSINMTVDEYEVLRLIDYEQMNQEECAKQMNVARSTVQRVYNIARKKLIVMLVEGRDVNIQGGNYEVCKERGNGCGSCRCHRGQENDKSISE